jgi:hypothetical protein
LKNYSIFPKYRCPYRRLLNWNFAIFIPDLFLVGGDGWGRGVCCGFYRTK